MEKTTASCDLQTYSARWIFPVAGPPLERGVITVREGVIVAVAPHGTRTADVDLDNVAILPGFVNAHTHLDLTGAGACRPSIAYASGSSDFTQWLRSVIAFRRTRTPEQVQTDIAAGLAECMRCGTTLIGDICAGGASWELLSQAHCRAVVFHELLGLTEERARQCWQAAQDWLSRHARTEDCAVGLSPHAPYSVLGTQYSALSTQPLPIATHLAETRAELQLLRDHAGPFVAFLKELNVWNPSGLLADPLDVVRASPSGIFIHGNYLDPATPFSPMQSLVVCPRTHQAFGHPRHPFPQMKVRIALGTDSLASNPDLDILAEARLLRRHYPEVQPAALLRMLTLNGAEALGFDAVAGSLTAGKSADLVILPLPDIETRDPHDLIFDTTLAVRRVMFRGRWSDEAARDVCNRPGDP